MKDRNFRDMYELVDDSPTLSDVDYCERELIDLEMRDILIQEFIQNLQFNSYENRLLAEDMLRKGYALAYMRKSLEERQ